MNYETDMERDVGAGIPGDFCPFKTWPKTDPIFPRAYVDIKIVTIHQNKSTSMGIDHAKGF